MQSAIVFSAWPGACSLCDVTLGDHDAACVFLHFNLLIRVDAHFVVLEDPAGAFVHPNAVQPILADAVRPGLLGSPP